MTIAALIAVIANIISAIKGTLEVIALVEDDGSASEIATKALATLASLLAAGKSVKEIVTGMLDEGVTVPELAELDALIDRIEALPPLADYKASSE